MKKFLNKKLVFVTLGVVVLLSGCSSNNDNYKVVTCTRSADLSDNNTSADLSYKIYYEDEYVKKTESTEKITSTNNETLKKYKSSYESVFEKYKDIKYYDNKVTLSGDTVISKTIIDYTKVDTDKIVAIEGKNGDIFTDEGKVKLSTLVALYKKYGSNCDD